MHNAAGAGASAGAGTMAVAETSVEVVEEVLADSLPRNRDKAVETN
jgi:hypothetical protein